MTPPPLSLLTCRFVWEETIWLRYLWESGDTETISGMKELGACHIGGL